MLPPCSLCLRGGKIGWLYDWVNGWVDEWETRTRGTETPPTRIRGRSRGQASLRPRLPQCPLREILFRRGFEDEIEDEDDVPITRHASRTQMASDALEKVNSLTRKAGTTARPRGAEGINVQCSTRNAQ